jgi:hypothetical protein
MLGKKGLETTAKRIYLSNKCKRVASCIIFLNMNISPTNSPANRINEAGISAIFHTANAAPGPIIAANDVIKKKAANTTSIV